MTRHSNTNSFLIIELVWVSKFNQYVKLVKYFEVHSFGDAGYRFRKFSGFRSLGLIKLIR